MLAGMMQRPRATSLRMNSGSSRSRLAMYCISSVITPCRARCICDMFRFPLAVAAAASLFSIQLSRNPMISSPSYSRSAAQPKKHVSFNVNLDYGTGPPKQQPGECHLGRWAEGRDCSAPPSPLFSDVWQRKDLPRGWLGCVAAKGLTGVLSARFGGRCGCVARKGLTPLGRSGGLAVWTVANMAEDII